MLTEKERFLKIVKENKRLLYKVINSYCKDAYERQDLEQEILIQIWKALKTYDDNYKLSTWLYRIALNVSISHYRKDNKRKEKIVSIDESLFERIDNTEGTEEDDNKIDLLYKFIAQLEGLNKAIIILYLEGNSYSDISEILGISETNVGTKINRIKLILKQNFNK